MIDTAALRSKIIDLAIQGKLTEQLPTDGTAEELYQQIQTEKVKLIKEKKIKKEKPLPEITVDEIPFDIPDNWKWVRFGDIGNYRKGPFGSALTKSMFVPKDDNVVKVYEQQHAIRKDANIGNYYISREYFENSMKAFEVISGDIIVSCAGTIGETFILPNDIEQGIINQALMRIKLFSGIDKLFFQYFFDAYLKRDAREESNGSAIKNIPPLDVMKKWLIPLPPLSEQKRIVAKIEEVLAEIKIIDELQSKYASNVDVLKSKIIDAGIRGQLTEQLPEDGTAEELYQAIQAEKAQLIKDKKIKKEKPLPEITVDEIPFDIPENWKWVRIGEIFQLHAGKNVKANCISNRANEEHRYSCYGGNGIRGYVADYNCDGIYPLIGRQGALCGNVHLAEGKFYATEHAVVTDTFANTDTKWAENFLKALNLNQYATATAQPGLAVNKIEQVLIPLPPLSEQKRIVAKIDEVFSALDKRVIL